MADIQVNQVFPSAKFIETDSKGDLQEVVGADATNSTASLQGIKIDSIATGIGSNGITFSITENNGSADSISINGSDVTLSLNESASLYFLGQTNPAVKASASIQGIEIEADVDGSAGNGITFEILESNGSANSISASGNTITLDLELSASSYQLSDVETILNGAGTDVTDLVDFTYSGNPSDSLTSAGAVTTTNGRDEVESISNILSGADSSVTDVVDFTITGANSDALTGASSVTLADATDLVTPDLGADKKYLLISTDDIFDFEVGEDTDGRKCFYGLLETASSNINNLASKPASLLINRGNLILVSDTQMRRSYQITTTLDILDSDLSPES
jgi:hypothetical protein